MGKIIACNRCGAIPELIPVLAFRTEHTDCGGTFVMMTKAQAFIVIMNHEGEKLLTESEKQSNC